ncbi:hypothetical protein GCM10009120_14760 [Sphingobacterium siyangense subsp. cladoniae]
MKSQDNTGREDYINHKIQLGIPTEALPNHQGRMHIADQHSVDQQQQNRSDPYRHKALAMDTISHLATCGA